LNNPESCDFGADNSPAVIPANAGIQERLRRMLRWIPDHVMGFAHTARDDGGDRLSTIVIPAKAGIQGRLRRMLRWIPDHVMGCAHTARDDGGYVTVASAVRGLAPDTRIADTASLHTIENVPT